MDWVDTDTRDASSALFINTWTIERCGDVKRALSQRANNARRKHALSPEERHEMAQLYRAVHEVESDLRHARNAVSPESPPIWVLNALHGRDAL